MTKIKLCLRGAKHNKPYVLEKLVLAKRLIGLIESFLHTSYTEATELSFRRFGAFREACFIGHYETGNNTAAAEETNYL